MFLASRNCNKTVRRSLCIVVVSVAVGCGTQDVPSDSAPVAEMTAGRNGSAPTTSASGGAGAAAGASGAGGSAGRANTPAVGGASAPSATQPSAAAGSNSATPPVGGTGSAGTSPPLPSAGSGAPPSSGPSMYKDPGIGPWQMGTPSECRMDPSKFEDSSLANYAVFRYGKLCHKKGGDGVGQMYSATKTLGGVTAGRCAQMAKDKPKTGPGTGPISPEDNARDWIPNARQGATISHVMAMVSAASSGLEDSQLSFRYDTVGSEAINGMVAATEKCAAQVGAPTDFTRFMRQEVFEKLGMKNSSYSPSSGIGTGWSGNVEDMGRIGTMLVHDGWYNGEQLLSPVWVYRMSHPAFESANTAYGHLAWVNHRGGSVAPGGSTSAGDPCAPAAFWKKYPHYQSKATDCKAGSGGCDQQYDVGIFSARGLGGQEITMHPGLDLVIVARNYSGGVIGMWAAVRPGLVAMDPMFKGDESAFCEAYGKGDYAPDLLVERDDGV